LNPGRRGGKPATNRLSYGAANSLSYYVFCNVVEMDHSCYKEIRQLNIVFVYLSKNKKLIGHGRKVSYIGCLYYKGHLFIYLFIYGLFDEAL
jgi:hypothetical protein